MEGDLHQAPVVRHAELASDRTVAPGEPVERAVQGADGEVIGDPLGGGEVVGLHCSSLAIWDTLSPRPTGSSIPK